VRRPPSFTGVHQGIGALLHPLFQRLGIKPTYLLSPEVVRDAGAVACLAALPGAFELGTHLHAEYAAPGADDNQECRAFQAALPPAIEGAKLASLTDGFVAAFGHRPRSFRAGRFGLGRETLRLLLELGYQVDSSVTPLLDWTGAGDGAPDFSAAPLWPYHPDARRPAQPGGSSLWEVPVTIRAGLWQRLPFIGRRLGRRLPHRWLRPTWDSPRRLIALARDVLDEAAWRARTVPSAPPAVLNVMFHNVEVIAGASPYAASEAAAQRILDRLAALLTFTRDAGVRSVGLADVPEFLT
jgi:hypothetical protein